MRVTRLVEDRIVESAGEGIASYILSLVHNHGSELRIHRLRALLAIIYQVVHHDARNALRPIVSQQVEPRSAMGITQLDAI